MSLPVTNFLHEHYLTDQQASWIHKFPPNPSKLSEISAHKPVTLSTERKNDSESGTPSASSSTLFQLEHRYNQHTSTDLRHYTTAAPVTWIWL